MIHEQQYGRNHVIHSDLKCKQLSKLYYVNGVYVYKFTWNTKKSYTDIQNAIQERKIQI